MENIRIVLNSYSVEEATVTILKQLLQDQPNLTNAAVSKLMNISIRTLYRLYDEHGIQKQFKQSGRLPTLKKAMRVLEQAGYSVELRLPVKFVGGATPEGVWQTAMDNVKK